MEWMILPLKRYAQFQGRSRRKEFWMWVLFTIIVSIVLGMIDGILGLGGGTTAQQQTVNTGGAFATGFNAGVRGGILANIFALATIIPNISVSVRRLHDTDRSGWWILLPGVPLFLGLVLLMAGATSGNFLLGIVGGIAMLATFVTGILLLVWYCFDGTPGPNRYGEDPKADFPSDLANTFE